MDQTQSTTSTGFEINSGAPVPLLNPSLGATSGLAKIAHEARNMVAALGLYCDLLEEPGVFAEPYRHYGGELKMVASASRGLVNRLLTLSSDEGSSTTPQLDASAALSTSPLCGRDAHGCGRHAAHRGGSRQQSPATVKLPHSTRSPGSSMSTFRRPH